jgi:hypothetical protein
MPLVLRQSNQDMEKRTRSFFDRFIATRGRPLGFQVITLIIVLLILSFAAAGLISLVIS